jgi:hypothetical protein
MIQVHEGCAVCGCASGRACMSAVVIEGRSLALCRAHAAVVVEAMPETFEDLRALFEGAGQLDACRSPLDRRSGVDRRVFPPRPEGRRMGGGRREGDPLDA